MEGFSSIVKVYATANALKDVIPFVPVYQTEARGRQRFRFFILKPVFIPRDWLKPPAEGGRTPREIIDHMMLILARFRGQETLGSNRVLDRRRGQAGKPWH